MFLQFQYICRYFLEQIICFGDGFEKENHTRAPYVKTNICSVTVRTKTHTGAPYLNKCICLVTVSKNTHPEHII